MGSMKKCPNCLISFDASRKQIFCSHKCKDAYNHKARRRLKKAGSKAEYHSIWQKYFRYHMPINGFEPRECPGCGVMFVPKTSKQIFHTKDCGAKYRSRQNHHKYSVDFVNRSPRNFINTLLSHKNRRKYLDIDYVMGIYDAQDGKCAISGREMTYLRGEGRVETNISIDRINRNKGYVPGNIQLVCAFCNKLKGMMSMDELIEFCQDVINNSSPTDNSPSNLRVVSRKTNRSKKENSRRRGSRRNKSSWGV